MNYSIAAQYRKGRICWTYLLALTMIDHTVRTFDTDLQQLVRKIGTMGSLVERQGRDAIEALLKHDAALAKSVMRSRDSVDAMQREIEDIVIVTMARR